VLCAPLLLKYGVEVEIKAPEFLREALIKQIAAMQKIYKNKLQPHEMRLSVWIMGIKSNVRAET
jgi:hypothetical protein